MTTTTESKAVTSTAKTQEARKSAANEITERAQKSSKSASKSTASKATQAVQAAKTAKTQETVAKKKTTEKTAAPKRVDTRTFQYGGVSRLKGKMRLRFTNNLKQRQATFKRDGDTEIEMIDFEKPMTKPELAKMMLKHEKFQSDEVQELLKKLVD